MFSGNESFTAGRRLRVEQNILEFELFFYTCFGNGWEGTRPPLYMRKQIGQTSRSITICLDCLGQMKNRRMYVESIEFGAL